MKTGDIIKTLAALALVGGCPAASWQQLLLRLAALPLTGLSEADLQQVFQTYLLLKSKGRDFGSVLDASGSPHILPYTVSSKKKSMLEMS